MEPISILIVLLGAICVAGGIFDWDWMMNRWRSRLIAKLLRGRRNARIFYILVGIALWGLAGALAVRALA
jgi:uncharacterized membrane protein YuzA (DUF378 family)